MTRVRHHLTYSNVVSTLCLFLLLGGGVAYAAGTIGSADIIDESILSQDIKNDEVQNPDLGANSVGTGKINDGAVRTADVLDDDLTGADISESSLATVPNADTLDGLDSTRLKNNAASVDGQGCLNLTSTETTCTSATLAAFLGDDVYLSASWRWYGTATAQDTMSCDIQRGSTLFASELFGQGGNEHNTNSRSASESLIALDKNAAFSNVYLLRCTEMDGSVSIVNSHIVAFRLSG